MPAREAARPGRRRAAGTVPPSSCAHGPRRLLVTSGIADCHRDHRIERVNDPVPSRLALLRFLERVQERDLARTRRWIADEERREVERRRGVQARPPAPEWLIELGRNPQAPPVFVHVGDCWMTGKRCRAVSQEQARRALADGVKACRQCQPDTALGVLD